MRDKFKKITGADDAQMQKLDAMLIFMLNYNEKVNLTRITLADDVWEKHFLDCAIPLENVPYGTFAADIGSGAGFPGIVWNILRPDLKITLIESTKKRADYLEALKEKLRLDCLVIRANAEELAHLPQYRASFDAAAARAVAPLRRLLKICLPLVKPGGQFFALKGPNLQAELEKCADEKKLNPATPKIYDYLLPSGDKRKFAVFQKPA